MIQLFKHTVYPESIENVKKVLESGWTGLGPKVAEFETKVKEYLDTPHAIALNSGTSALQIALSCLNVTKGSYIITTPLTFISTNHSILQAGYYPVFADVESDTGNISAESIERLIKRPFIESRAKAIMAVHYGGMPIDMDAIYSLAEKYNLAVIEDAAHAFGAEYEGAKIGCKYSRFVCFSFHSVKPLAIGDGGMLTTNDPSIDGLARNLRWCGIDKSTHDRFSGGYSWDYDVKNVGFKMHMNDIMAAIGLGQLQHYEDDKKYRQAMVDKYREGLQDIAQIELLKTFPNRVSANHLEVIRCCSKEHKRNIVDALKAKGIETGCHYRPTIAYKQYRNFDTDEGCKNAIDFFERAISLPLHMELDFPEIELICETIKGVNNETKTS